MMIDTDRQAAIAALQARRAARGMNDPLNRLTAHINRSIAAGASPIVAAGSACLWRCPVMARPDINALPFSASYAYPDTALELARRPTTYARSRFASLDRIRFCRVIGYSDGVDSERRYLANLRAARRSRELV